MPEPPPEQLVSSRTVSPEQLAAAAAVDGERQAELVRAFLAGYGQAIADFGVHARQVCGPRRRPWRRRAARS